MRKPAFGGLRLISPSFCVRSVWRETPLLCGNPRFHRILIRTAKALIRLCRGAGWSEHWLTAHVIKCSFFFFSAMRLVYFHEEILDLSQNYRICSLLEFDLLVGLNVWAKEPATSVPKTKRSLPIMSVIKQHNISLFILYLAICNQQRLWSVCVSWARG